MPMVTTSNAISPSELDISRLGIVSMTFLSTRIPCRSVSYGVENVISSASSPTTRTEQSGTGLHWRATVSAIASASWRAQDRMVTAGLDD